MYQLKISRETRQRIGDILTAQGCDPMPISELSEAVGISRVTLTKWTRDILRLYDLTRHISDEELSHYVGRSYYGNESRFCDHAQEYRRKVKIIRADALSGELGRAWQLVERDRKREERQQPKIGSRARLKTVGIRLRTV